MNKKSQDRWKGSWLLFHLWRGWVTVTIGPNWVLERLSEVDCKFLILNQFADDTFVSDFFGVYMACPPTPLAAY